MSTASRRWVKVWHEILLDTDFHDLPLDQQARYYNLLVFVSAKGNGGYVSIQGPARSLVHLLQCEDYTDLIECIRELPGIEVETVTPAKDTKNHNAVFSVTFLNWYKYQVDSTGSERQRRYRGGQSVTPKEKRRKEEEKEEDKNKKKTTFDIFWKAYPKKKSKGQAEKAWEKIKPSEQLLETMLSTIETAKTSKEWAKDNGEFIPYPATWLNAKGWEDEYTLSEAKDPEAEKEDLKRKVQ